MLKRSTLTHFLCAHLGLESLIDAKQDVDNVFLDLSKASDVLNHRLFLDKLEALALSPAICKWVASFLGNSSMTAQIKGAFHLRFQFAQRSQSLCLRFPVVPYYHLPSFSTSRHYLFAVDIKLVCLSNEIATLLEDLKQSFIWTDSWEMQHMGLNVNIIALAQV